MISNSKLEKSDLGHWQFLAATCDLAARKIVFLVDGAVTTSQSIGMMKLDAVPSLKLGPASIGGRYNSNDLYGPYPSLPGRIGELILFGEALSPEELHRICQGTSGRWSMTSEK